MTEFEIIMVIKSAAICAACLYIAFKMVNRMANTIDKILEEERNDN